MPEPLPARPSVPARLRPLLLAAAALAAGLAVAALLFGASLAAGAPAFSSLRTDPQGSSVLFGACQRAGLTVVRGFDRASLDALPAGRTVAFVLAPAAWPDGLADALTAFARRGGRVVVAQPPQPAIGGPEVDWGYAEREDRSLKLTGPWTVLDPAPGVGQLATRDLGRGNVVVATSAAFASNRSLADHPDPALLARLVGSRTTVWVDETSHGLEAAHGLAWLIRRYRLRVALMLGLIAVGLALWRLAATLERAPAAAREDFEELSETAFDGYVRLLRRALTEEELNHELSHQP